MAGYIISGIILVVVFYIIFLYNNLIRNKNNTENAFGSVDAMLKKRYDLIPNLVETVKQYMIHEASVFDDITKLRSQLSNNITNEEKVDLHNAISKKLNSALLTVENYPDLKASQNFLKLQASWNETEEQISSARRYYNAAVTEYNNSVLTFPSNILAKKFNFSTKKVFEIEEIERKNVNAKELFK